MKMRTAILVAVGMLLAFAAGGAAMWAVAGSDDVMTACLKCPAGGERIHPAGYQAMNW